MDYKYNIKRWLKAMPFKERMAMRDRIEKVLGVNGVQTSRYINTLIDEPLELDTEQLQEIAKLFDNKIWVDVLSEPYRASQKAMIESRLAALTGA